MCDDEARHSQFATATELVTAWLEALKSGESVAD
jgi:hypothetical protein